MSKWSRDAAKRFIDQREAKRVSDERVLHDAKLLENFSPSVWDDIKQTFKSVCDEFNSEPGVGSVLSFYSPDSNHLTIARSDSPITLKVEFLPATHALRIEGLKEPELFSFEVEPGSSKGILLVHPKAGPTSSYDLATRAIELFLNEEQ